MSTGADSFTVSGYTACRICGEHFVTDGKRRCASCRDALKVIGEAEAVARAASRPAPRRTTRGRKAKKLTAAQRAQKRLWNRARSNALTRLRQIHPELYSVLLAEEKARLGLSPELDVRSANVGPLERALSA